jgi:heavy metal sensor kinase
MGRDETATGASIEAPVGVRRSSLLRPLRPLSPLRPLGRVPIRWRLTVWYAGFLAAALLLFGAAIYFGLRWRLHDEFDDQLRNQAGLTLATIRAQRGSQTILPDDPLGELDEDDAFLRLLDGEGVTVAYAGTLLADLPLESAAVRAAFDGQTNFASVSLDGDPYRVISVPVRDPEQGGQVVGVLQVGMDRDEIDEELALVFGLLVVFTPLVLLVAVLGGYGLARRALAPVAEVTALAERVSATDLHARLNLDVPDDELGRLARTFDRMLARMEDAFERQRRFTGDAAHELRTPLSLMRSRVDLALARPRSPDEYRAALRDLDADLQRLTGMVATLLALARADEGSLTLDRAPLDLQALCELVLEQFAAPAAAAGVTLRDESEPLRIVADEDRLVQVLVNLVDNALAHTPAGGTIAVGCRSVADGHARLWVADTGRGIPPEHRERVFDRFYRVDTGRTAAALDGGAGLGLSITKAIVEAHGGTITLTSEVGEGTRVEVRL